MSHQPYTYMPPPPPPPRPLRRGTETDTHHYYYLPPWIWKVGIIFGIFLGVWAVILGYVVSNKNSGGSGSEITTEFFDPPPATISTQENTMMIPCRNFTLGTETKSFSGDTFLGIVCPTPLNPCLINTCGSDGFCQEELADPNGCYHDSMCTNATSTNGTKCDLSTCMCVSEPPAPPGCEVDDDCMLIANSMCESVTCQDGRCVRNNTMPSGCGSSQDCASGEICDSNCTCVSASVGVTAVEYTPTFDFTDPALDLGTLQNLTANFIDLGNYVKVRIQYSAFANGTTNQDFSFDFSLPSGLLADTSGNAVGSHIVQTTPGLITSASNTTLSGQGTVTTLDSDTGTATGANTNPLFTGPSEVSDLYTGVVFFEYFKA